MDPSLATLLERYPNIWLVAVYAFALTTFFTLIFYRLALNRRWLPAVRARDVHTVPKPRIGGLAMWLAIVTCFAWLLFSPERARLLNFNHTPFLGMDRALWGIVLGMLVILLTGLWDDLRGLSWPYQLLGQFLAALMLVLGRVGVSYIRLPLARHLDLGGLGGGVFTIVWIMTMMNVMNFFDGLDGLAGSVAVTASIALLFLSLKFGFLATATLSLLVAGASFAFLLWNWHPAKLFMGTVGSQLLGFLLGTVAIISGGKVATAVLVLGIPVLDAVIVIFRRLVAGVSPFQADQRHLHHRLMKIGLTVPGVVILVNAVAALFAVLALHTQEANGKGLLTLLLVGCMAVCILITYALERRAGRRVK